MQRGVVDAVLGHLHARLYRLHSMKLRYNNDVFVYTILAQAESLLVTKTIHILRYRRKQIR